MGQPQMGYNNSMGYGAMGPAGGMPMTGPGGMQGMQGGGRYPGPGMPGTKQALQNMLRQRTTPGAGGQYVPVPPGGGPPMVGMMRPSGGPGQYGGNSMMPSGPPQGMVGGMTRPMYAGGQMQAAMNPGGGYGGGMQAAGGQSYGMGYGANSPQMRMATPGEYCFLFHETPILEIPKYGRVYMYLKESTFLPNVSAVLCYDNCMKKWPNNPSFNCI